MKLTIKLLLILTITILASPVIAHSAANLTIDTVTEKQEVAVVNGVQQVRFVKSEKVTPGETLRFTLKFKNTGDAVAENVALNNPLPLSSVYIAGSATTFKGTSPQFSVDKGQTFSTPSTLTYEIKNPDGSSEMIVAPPEKYTHIRWQLPPIEAGAAGQVSFNVLIQ